jgi:hypothetical protein
VAVHRRIAGARRKVLVAGLLLVGAATCTYTLAGWVVSAPDDGKPCVRFPGLSAWPLLVGDTTSLEVGVMGGSSCVPPSPSAFRWSTRDSAVVRVDPSGLVHGLAPGDFEAIAVGPDTTLLFSGGFVLPRGWRLVTVPDSAAAFVGDSVLFTDFATDSMGHRFPDSSFTRNRFLRSRWVPATRPVNADVGARLGGRVTRAILSVPGGRPGGTVQLFTRFQAPRYRADAIPVSAEVASSLQQLAFRLVRSATPVSLDGERVETEYTNALDGHRLVVTPERPVSIAGADGEVLIAQIVVVIPDPGRSPSLLAMRAGGWIDAYSNVDTTIIGQMRTLLATRR